MSKSAVYISTEAALSTARLSQLLKSHPLIQSLPALERPSLSRIHSIQTPDLESQDHILRFQVPVAIERYNVGLVIIDSIAANYRAEFHEQTQTPARNANGLTSGSGSAIGLAERRDMLVSLGSYLRRLAKEKNVAIVVANQVADRFISDQQVNQASTNNTPKTDVDSHSRPPSTPLPQGPVLTALGHQQRFFTGWGDYSVLPNIGTREEIDHVLTNPSRWKTPALGLVWANQIAGRIALIREPLAGSHVLSPEQSRDEDGRGVSEKRRRFLRVAFASWAQATSTFERGVEYEITGAGLKCLVPSQANGISSQPETL
jgi:DNA repair protein RAD57